MTVEMVQGFGKNMEVVEGLWAVGTVEEIQKNI